MKGALRAGIVAMALAIGGCATVTATYDFDPAVDFDAYRTFTWVSARPLIDPAPANPALGESIERSARELLTAKGYRFVASAADADFVIGFGLGASDQLRIDSYPAAYRGPWHWSARPETAVREVTEGRLVVDVFDQKTQRPVWHGTATRTITTRDRQHPSQAIRAALATIFANFPPG